MIFEQLLKHEHPQQDSLTPIPVLAVPLSQTQVEAIILNWVNVNLPAWLTGHVVIEATQSQPAIAFGNVYHNTTGDMLLLTTIILNGSGDSARYYCDAANPPLTEVAYCGHTPAGDVYQCISIQVPRNYYFQLESTSGSPSIFNHSQWIISIDIV